LQPIGQHALGLGETFPDGDAGHPFEAGDLPYGEVPPVVGGDREAQVLGEIEDGPSEVLGLVTERDRFFGARRWVVHALGALVLQGDEAARAAGVGEKGGVGDPVEPGREAGLALEPGKRRPGLAIGLLGEVGGQVRIAAGEAVEDAVDGTVGPLHQSLGRVRVTVGGGPQEAQLFAAPQRAARGGDRERSG
jgi:hypothetical protein